MKKIAVLALATLFTGCAMQEMAMVIPKEGGTYDTTSFGPSKKESQEIALYTANKTCDNRQMRHVVSEMETEYQGTIDENINKTVNTVTSIIASTTGNYYGSTATEEDYKTTLSFKCQ